MLQSLRQDGWHISFQKYGEFQGYTLPTRLLLTRGDTEAKVIIARWRTTVD